MCPVEVHYETEEAAKQADHRRLNPLSNILRWYRFASKWEGYPASVFFAIGNIIMNQWISGYHLFQTKPYDPAALTLPIRDCYRPLKRSTACKLVRRQWGSQATRDDWSKDLPPADLRWHRNITRGGKSSPTWSFSNARFDKPRIFAVVPDSSNDSHAAPKHFGGWGTQTISRGDRMISSWQSNTRILPWFYSERLDKTAESQWLPGLSPFCPSRGTPKSFNGISHYKPSSYWGFSYGFPTVFHFRKPPSPRWALAVSSSVQIVWTPGFRWWSLPWGLKQVVNFQRWLQHVYIRVCIYI